jgi:hypothetical protein
MWRYHLAILLSGLTTFCQQGLAQQSEQQGNALVEQVFAKLLAVPAADRPAIHFDAWPPKAQIIDPARESSLAESAGSYNAFAYAPNCIPQVRITEGLMNDVVQGDSDRLALILGHELGHLLLGHTQCARGTDKSPVVEAAFTRDQEFAADHKGIELALAAGYSARKGYQGFERLAQISDYSSFEALTKNHPSWAERLARLDTAQAELWRSMSAFQDGVYFLESENYPDAERCFRSVVTEFPEADDAWANRGYARLMEFADNLTTGDLRSFGIDQVVVGAFYSRPAWLSGKARGIDDKAWQEAVSALSEAGRLNQNLALAKANLGVAYLLDPAGKDTQRAIALLEAAVSLLRKDQSLAAQAESDPRSPIIAVANNLAVAYSAADRFHDASALLESISKMGFRRSATGFLQSQALIYNYAMLIARMSDLKAHREAQTLFEEYLENSSKSSSWWPMAYERYAALSKELGISAKTQDQLQRSIEHTFRQVSSVDVGGGHVIALGQKLGDIPQSERWQEVTTVNGTALKRLRSPENGLDVLADSDRIVAIYLRDSSGPTLSIRRIGMDAHTDQLRVGMTATDVDKILGGQPYRFESLTDTWTPYRFYPYLGIAMTTGANQLITELVIVQTTRQ